MELSTSFSIDPSEPWVAAHNAEARAVMEAFGAGRPVRVPVLCGEWRGQHGFYAEEIGLDYREYYTDPEVMLRVQLEAARRRRELPIYDLVLGEAPERWSGVGVDLWPVVGPGWVGCPLVYREHAVIAHQGLKLSREECDALPMPDPRTGGLLATVQRFFQQLRARYEGTLTFLGRPVGPLDPGVGTNGFFSLALDLRGEALMADMYEAPAFAHRFLRKIGSWAQELQAAWGRPRGLEIGDHGIDMLSPWVYEEFIVPVLREANGEGWGPVDLHHCGRGAHLFPVIKKHFGLRGINALTFPLVDIAKVRRDLGEEVEINAIIEEGVLQQGPPERLREVVRELMGAKGRGGLSLSAGDMLRGIPLAHRVAVYEAVKEYGRY